MRGVTHAISGGTVYAALGIYVWHQPLPILATGTALAIGAATLPDMDQRGSCAARSFGWITECGASVVHRIAGGHREGTHEAVGNVICAALALLAIALEGWHLSLHWHGWAWHPSVGRLILGAYLALLFGAGMKALRHPRRDFRREVLAIAAAGAMVYFSWDTGGIAWAILLGTVVHCAGDGLTKDGCPWLEPITSHRFHLLPKRARITTGKAVERVVICPALVLVLAFLAWHAITLPGALTI